MVVQLLAVVAPPRPVAAGVGDLPTAGPGGKGLHVDLSAVAHRVGAVSDPLAVGRDLRVRLVGRRVDERRRFLVGQRQHPEIALGLRVLDAEDDRLPVTRPRHRCLREVRFGQQLFLARSIRSLPVQARLTLPERAEHDVASVGRPHRARVVLSGIPRQTRVRTGRLDDPDVAARLLMAVDGDPLHVWRHLNAAETARGPRPLRHLATTARPRQVPFSGIRLGAGVPGRAVVLEVGEHATRRRREMATPIRIVEADFIGHTRRFSRQRERRRVEGLRVDGLAAMKQQVTRV